MSEYTELLQENRKYTLAGLFYWTHIHIDDTQATHSQNPFLNARLPSKPCIECAVDVLDIQHCDLFSLSLCFDVFTYNKRLHTYSKRLFSLQVKLVSFEMRCFFLDTFIYVAWLVPDAKVYVIEGILFNSDSAVSFSNNHK